MFEAFLLHRLAGAWHPVLIKSRQFSEKTGELKPCFFARFLPYFNMIKAFIEKAQQNLIAAQVLIDQDLYDAAVNRAYYASFQAAVAALAKAGIVSQKNEHRWVQSNFNGELIKKRKVYPGRIKAYLTDLQKIRNIADYSDICVSQKVTIRQVMKAKKFVDTILEVIKKT